MAQDKNRCWPGYEPVKGKKPKSQGSCRPKAESKLTGSEKDFRKKRERQLEEWQAEHPHSRKSAPQHLHAPGAGPKKAAAKSKKRKTAAKPKRTTSSKRTAASSRNNAKK